MNDSPSAWKKIVIKAFGFGAGFAGALAVIAVFLAWYSSRPTPPRPWNTRAITATYEFVTTTKDKDQLAFVYTIQNNTKEDYRLSEVSSVDLFHKLESEQSIYRMAEDRPSIHFPVFVPAGGRTTVSINSHLSYSAPRPASDDLNELKKTLREYVKEKHQNLGGFVLFDQINRYQIDFPKGW